MILREELMNFSIKIASLIIHFFFLKYNPDIRCYCLPVSGQQFDANGTFILFFTRRI